MDQNHLDQRVSNGYDKPGQEIAKLISASLASKQEPDPAGAILHSLNTEVEAKARDLARHEIDDLASRIMPEAEAVNLQHETPQNEALSDETPNYNEINAARINPFAPRPLVPAPVTWLSDAINAQEAREASGTWDRMASFTSDEAVIEEITAQDASVEEGQAQDALAAEVTEDITVIPPLGYQAPESGFEADDISADLDDALYDEARGEEAALAVSTTPALSAGDNGWFGHSEGGLPIWISAGVPVAAVSLFALGFVFMERPDPVQTAAAFDASSVAVETAAVPDVSLATAEIIATPPGQQAIGLPDASLGADAEIASGIVPSLTPELNIPPKVVPVSQNQSALAAGSSAIYAAPAVVATVEPGLESRTAPAPGLKPVYPNARPLQNPAPVISQSRPAVAYKPRRTLPVRMFTGPIENGSAAALATAAAEIEGPALSRSEKLWLARDMERVLDNEIDGRSVSLKARTGERVRVHLNRSEQVQRAYSFSRVREMGALPHNIVLAGGWYAAKQDVMLHATPALNSGLSHRVLKRDALIERMGTYTDRYGDRWYLMGQRGLAVGFLSAADVTLAAVHNRPYGDPYAATPGAHVNETRIAYTNCREGYVGPEAGLVSKMQVCRDPKGHWVSYREGVISAQHANRINKLSPKTDTASAIVLAEATGDPVTYHAFGNRMFRRRLQSGFTHASVGQTTEQTLPNGDLIRFTFGDRYEEARATPLLRVEALGAVETKFRVDAGMMKLPIGAKLRAMPDSLSQADLGEVPAGRAIETIGMVKGVRGDDWMLVGRSGVGFGYVPVHKLAPVEGRVSPYVIDNVRLSATTVDLVQSVHTCRTVAYETIEGVGTFDACQQTDGSWAPKAAPNNGPQFAQGGDSQTPVAP